MAASSLFTKLKASGLSVGLLSTFSFVVVSVTTSSVDWKVCEDCFGGEAVVVVVVVVSSDRLDKKTKANELQNYIYFSKANHFPMSVPLDWTFTILWIMSVRGLEYSKW